MKNRIVWTSALLVSSMGMLAATGCKGSTAPGAAPIVDGSASATDPAMGNMAMPGTQVAGSAFAATQKVSTESYPLQQSAPAQANYGTGNSQQNEAYQYNTQAPANGQQYAGDPQANAAEYDQYSALLDPNVPAAQQPPPQLPDDYNQPEAPGPDYLWTPGYWDYSNAGYYYVPGVWVGSPYAGALWTPGWWGFLGGRYRWHHGYWGEHVGYYGGINYGFGYVGYGYQGGYWNGGHFRYNTSVLRVNPRYVNNNVYQRNVTVENRTYINNSRTSFVGGQGGLRRGPAPQELAAIHEQHTAPMQAQVQHREEASQNKQQFFNSNNGKPAMTAAARPIAADHNVSAPARVGQQQGFVNGARPGGQPGVENRPAENRVGGGVNGQPQANIQQRNDTLQQRNENLQQRNENLQQRGQIEQQHTQQMQIQTQQRVQEDQQRNQQVQQRQQQDAQRQQDNVQRQQQQLNVQRQGQVQPQPQRVQPDQHTQQPQMNVQREPQNNVQRPQQDVQRPQPQLQQQRVMPMAQPNPRAEAPQPRVEAPRAAPAPQAAPRPAPAPAPVQQHAAPAAAPAPHAAPAPGGGGEHHH